MSRYTLITIAIVVIGIAIWVGAGVAIGNYTYNNAEEVTEYGTVMEREYVSYMHDVPYFRYTVLGDDSGRNIQVRDDTIYQVGDIVCVSYKALDSYWFIETSIISGNGWKFE